MARWRFASLCRRLLPGPLLALAAAPSAPQSIGNATNLSFGSFIAASAGSVGMGPTGLRSRSGGVLLVGQGAIAEAAQFIVSGTAHAVYAITLPQDGVVSLSSPQGHTMAVTGFVSSPAAAGSLSPVGSARVNVGATLVVGPGQPPGAYAGSFSVIVNYN